MKRHSVIAIIAAAALLTGCSSGKASDTAVGSGTAAHGSVGGASTSAGAASEVGSAGAEGSSGSGVSGTSGTSGVAGSTDGVVTAPDTDSGSHADMPPESGSASEAYKPDAAGESSTASSEGSAGSVSTPAVTTAAPAVTGRPGGSDSGSSGDKDYAPVDIGGTGADGFEADVSVDDIAALDVDVMSPEAASLAGGDTAASGFVECPEPTDPLEPIEPIIPDDPWIDPQAGLLTGGEWNDNENWDFWNSLYSSNNYGVDWTGYLQNWRTGMEYRAAVTVRDSSGTPVSSAKVEGMGYSAVTDNKGRAYLFWDEARKADGTAEFSVTYGGKTQIFSGDVDGGELEFTQDSAEKPAAKSLDLMIMCDTTGSMGDELEYLKAELEDVVTRIRNDNANVPTRISVDFYRDEGDEYVVREFPFTTDLDAAVSAISQQSANGGGDTPEAVHTALRSAVSHDWGEESVKVMFLVLDAPPHEDAQVIDEVVKYTREAAEKGIRIVPVAASGVDKSCEYLLRSMAAMTGGTYTFLTNDSGIGYDHMEPTIGSYDVEKLNDMMVRIVSGYLG